MKIDSFDAASLAIGGISSVLFCIQAALTNTDERPDDGIISNAIMYLAMQSGDLEQDMDRLISEALREKRQLKAPADKNRLKLKLSDFPTAAEISVRERTKEKEAI